MFDRKREAEELRHLLVAAGQVQMPYAYSLFMQATLAFECGTDIGTNLLCRASLEAACYVFLSRVKVTEGERASSWRIEKLKLKWPKVRKAIEQRGVLSPDQLMALDDSRERGNLVAHMADIIDRSLSESGHMAKVPLWVTTDEARRALNASADILKTLGVALYQDH